MAIREIEIKNFKGIAGQTSFELKPITIFIGPNSSGKSSCLHGIAALAQTIKLGNSIPALILDDEYAQVHLGRFIEIAHSKSYAHSIQFRLNLGDLKIQLPDDLHVEGVCSATYSFKCNKVTEEIYLNEARLQIGDTLVQFKKKKSESEYTATCSKYKISVSATRKSNFFFQILPPTSATNPKEIEAIKKYWFNLYLLVETVQSHLERTLRQTLYLGPFRQSPLRRYPFRGSTALEVGPQGEATITMLASEVVQPKAKPHFTQINNWLIDLGLAKRVGVSRVGSSDLFDVSITMKDDKSLPIADLGYGLSQILPVLAQCSFAPSESTLLFEQPELHLHEGAARKLAGVFVDTAESKKSTLVIETHSKELVHELFELIKSGRLQINDLAIYSVERIDGKSHYTRVSVEMDDGYLEVSDPWVNGILN